VKPGSIHPKLATQFKHKRPSGVNVFPNRIALQDIYHNRVDTEMRSLDHNFRSRIESDETTMIISHDY